MWSLSEIFFDEYQNGSTADRTFTGRLRREEHVDETNNGDER